MLCYRKHALYKLEKTKIAFEHHRLIDVKLCRPTFNYPKFHATSHLVQCIGNYNSVVNYDTAHSEATHKYLFKVFYNRTNKKEYIAQIQKHNICYTNVIAIKDVVISKKTQEKERQLVVRNVDKIA